jgi:hypothetical protein
MDAHQILKIVGGALTMLLFIPLIVGVLRDGGVGQSFATWILWAALDAILIVSLVEQHGNYPIAVGFAIGDTALAGLLLYKGRVTWGRFETAILLMVIVCLGVWKFSGPMVATIAATTGGCLGGLPGLVTLWRNPNRKLGNIWAGYVLANGLSFLGGTAMNIEERFAPGIFTVFSVLMFLASRRTRV